MSNTTRSNGVKDFGAKASSGWGRVQPYASAFVIGLVVGPIASAIFGWQVLSSTADKRSTQAAVALQAQICAAQARAVEPKAAELSWNVRGKLAEQWAVMPGSTEPAPGVVSACSDILANRA